MYHYPSDLIVPVEGVEPDLPLNEGDFIEEWEEEEMESERGDTERDEEMVEEEEEDPMEFLEPFEINFDGSRTGHHAFDNRIEPSRILIRAIGNIDLYVNYMGCAQCSFPLVMQSQIHETLYSLRHTFVRIGHVILLDDTNRIRRNTIIGAIPPHPVYWQITVRCGNCRALLSVGALNIFNAIIDEYTNEEMCAIIDENAVSFFRVEWF